jgi:ribosomal protein S18 acetylase RimI-like enzyme
VTTARPTGTSFATQPDPWLSRIIGRPALRLTMTDAPSDDWKKRLKSDDLLVTAKLPADQVADANFLQDLGFHTIDTALTFETPRLSAAPSDRNVRFAHASDREAVARLAGTAFVYSRFHLDPALPKTLANKVKATWASNFFAGQRGDGMVVAERDGVVAGFLQLLWAGPVLVIDLIAVSPQATRQGHARAMLAFAAANGTGDMRRPEGFRVGTQAANAPSVRLYESLGFRFTDAQFVLHHHGHGGPYRTEGAT